MAADAPDTTTAGQRPPGTYRGGAGCFGEWVTDEFGLPAYRYRLDQHADPRGSWLRDRHLGERSTLAWHQIGNDRITAITTNDGWTQLYSHEFGPRWVNMHRPELRCFAGGVSYLRDEDDNLLSTFYPGREPDAQVERLWGCGYSRYRIEQAGLRLERTVFAPFGDSPYLVALVRLGNRSDRARRVEHLEYWDLHLHNLDATGPRAAGIAGDELDASIFSADTPRRDALSAFLYDGYQAHWDKDRSCLLATHPWREIVNAERDWPGGLQRNRPDITLAALGVAPDRLVTRRTELFPDADYTQPGTFRPREATDGPASTQPVLAALSGQVLGPGEEVVLGYAYGATPAWETDAELETIGRADPQALLEETMDAWRSCVADIDLGDDDLRREMAWSAYYLRSGSVYHRQLRAHTLPQGGAYQYIGGGNAGPRATLQHVLPLIHLSPALAKDVIRFTLSQTHPSGEMPYAEVQNGVLDALRYYPSDHALWLLWAVAEYVLATRDRQFLREVCSYWPPPYTRPEPVWDHCLLAFRHLVEEVGFGPHGLLRLRTSDWNDTITQEGDVPIDTVWATGESTLNSAMACHVLPRFAELADYAGEGRAAQRVRDVADRLAGAVRASWRQTHLNRGWRGDGSEVGTADLYLEPQPWALISGVLDDEQNLTLVRTIGERLSDTAGARIFAPGGEGNKTTAGGGPWYAINSTLVWGLSKVDPERAWDELKRNTLHQHAETYPEVWFGIWSGPDTYRPSTSRTAAGQTWSWGSFGLQLWPVQIMFAHSEPLNAALWMLGIEADRHGLAITPRAPQERWSLHTPLLRIDYSPERVALRCSGGYGNEHMRLRITLPPQWDDRALGVTVNGRPAARHERDGSELAVTVPAFEGRPVSVTVEPVTP